MNTCINKNNIRIVGNIVILRSIKKEDANKIYLDFLNDKRVNKFLDDAARKKYTLHDLTAFVKGKIEKKDCIFLAILDKESGLHIGNVKIEPIDAINKRADIGIMIGNTKFWGKGYGTETMHLTVQFCFKNLLSNRVQLKVITNNIRAIKTYKKVGFVEEGILKEYTIRNGKKYDWLVMRILKQEYPFKGKR